MSLTAVSGTRRPIQLKRRWLRRLLANIWSAGKYFLGLVLCVACAWGGITIYKLVRNAEYFRLRTVRIVGNNMLTRQDLLYLLALPSRATLFQLDVPRMGSRLKRHPYIKAVTIRRQLPDTLAVTIQERVPYLVVNGAEQRVILDEEGVVLRPFIARQDDRLPQLTLRQKSTLASGVQLRQEEVRRALEVVRAYKTSPVATAMHLVSLTVEESGSSNWTVEPYAFNLRLGKGNIGVQLGRLPPVLQYLAQQNLAVHTVDLSYHKRIVVVPEKFGHAKTLREN